MSKAYGGSVTGGRQSAVLALKQNQAYCHKLNNLLKSIPKKALGVYAASALDVAIRATKHDSSRAGANWNLSFGAAMPPVSWDPANYGTAPAGQRGDKGANREETLQYKAMHYGYSGASDLKTPQPGGILHVKLGIGKLGTAPTVLLYNPIFSPGEKTALYAQHAFGGGEAGVGEEVFKGEVKAKLSELPSTFAPVLIHEMAEQVRWLNAGKLI